MLTFTRTDRLAEIRWPICISKFQWSLCVSFSRADTGFCIYELFVQSNLNFLHSSQWITFTHRIMSTLILSLSKSTSFAYNVIDRFVSLTKLSTSAILLRSVYFCFDIVSPYGVVSCCYLKRFSFSLTISLS